MTLNPRESGKFISENAKYLSIESEGIDNLVKAVVAGIKAKDIDINNFSQHAFHPKPNDPNAMNWVFLIDTLNFCFWTPGNDTKWKVENNTGYFALCAAINRAIRNGIDITNPKFYATITERDLKDILESDEVNVEAPLLKERVDCLHEVGAKLLEKYDGNFENCVKECGNSAQKLLQLIVTEFPCFRDEADFKGKRVSILKRAQILVGDIWACYRGEGLGEFLDIGTITMFADYRVPQVLVHFGALKYSSKLMDVLKADTLLTNGSEMEVEIRGASIHIVELLKSKLLKILAEEYPELSAGNVNSVLLDHFLWDYRRQHATELEYIPFHKTISVYY